MVALGALVACSNLHAVDDTGSGDSGLSDAPDLPVLDVSQPARGTFHPGPVKVSGRVEQGTGSLVSVTINDAGVPFESDGAFEATLDPDPGMLILGLRAEDDLGERAVDGRAVQVGPVNSPGDILQDAVALQIGPEMLDDDQPDLDDLAGVAAAVVKDPSFTEALVGVTLPGTFDITLNSLAFDDAEIDIIPKDGVLWLDTYLTGVDSTFTADVVIADIDGWAKADLAAIQMDLEARSDGDAVVVEAVAVNAWLEGFTWGAEWVPDWAEKALADTVRGMVEDSLEEEAMERVPALVGETLSSFAVDTTFGDGDTLHVTLSISDVASAEAGLVLWMDASVYAEQLGIDLPVGAGSLATPGAPPTLPMATDQPLTVVADDDFLNQVLFAFWHGGALGGWELDGAAMAALTGDDLPPPLGPVKTATLDVNLPPIISAPSGDMDLDLSIGELVIDIVREDDVEVEVSLNSRVGADLAFTDDGLSMTLDNRPAQMTIQAGMLQWPQALDPGDLASLFRLSTPALLGQSSNLFPAFPAPDLPVGELLDVDAVGDLVWAMEDAEVTVEPSGWVVLQGRMNPR